MALLIKMGNQFYRFGELIHILLIIAIVVALLRIIQVRNPL
jgi:hypothetical protein